MANPFYQPPVPRPPAARTERAIPMPRMLLRGARYHAGLMMRRGFDHLMSACLSRAGSRGYGSRHVPGRDVLWRAKCNALHRALADHDLTVHQARVILCRLSGIQAHGCELARLGVLSGFEEKVLDRAVPLLGLQNFITVREREPRGSSGPVLWVSATEHGLRYAAEALAALTPGASEMTSQERA